MIIVIYLQYTFLYKVYVIVSDKRSKINSDKNLICMIYGPKYSSVNDLHEIQIFRSSLEYGYIIAFIVHLLFLSYTFYK